MTAAELLDLGEKYLLDMNYEQALVQFLVVIEIEPMNPRGYTGAAEAYVGLDKKNEAIAVLQKGVQLTASPIIKTMLEGLTITEVEIGPVVIGDDNDGITEPASQLETANHIPETTAISEAYLEILQNSEHEIHNSYLPTCVVVDDITGDGIPELIYIQADYGVWRDFDSEELTPYSKENPEPWRWMLVIWTYKENHPYRLLSRMVSINADGGGNYCVSHDGKGNLNVIYGWGPDGEFALTFNIYNLIDGVYSVVSSTELLKYNNFYENGVWLTQYSIDGVETSESAYSAKYDELFGSIGSNLLFSTMTDDSSSQISKGYYETVAELQGAAQNLSEIERVSLVADGVYYDLLSAGYLPIVDEYGTSVRYAKYYCFLDMDNDGINELIVADSFYNWNIYAFIDGKVQFLTANKYLTGEKQRFIIDNRIIWESSHDDWMSARGWRFVESATIYYFYDKNDMLKYYNEYWEIYEGEEVNRDTYWMNDREISESEYQNFVVSITGDEIPMEIVMKSLPLH